jgi:molybdopterin converting factor subunit 1
MNEEQQLTVLYFGLLGERRGLPTERLGTSAATPLELYLQLAAEHPLGLAPDHLRVAVNDEFVAWDHRFKSGDRVAFLPPMSGG